MPSFRLSTVGWLLVTFLLGTLGCHPSEDSRPGDAPSLLPAPPAPVIAVLGPDGPPPGEDSWETAAPRLLEYGPQGSAAGDRALYLRFSTPMRMDTEGPSAPVFDLTPKVAGTLRWIDAYRLDYVFDERPPPASLIEVHAHGTPKTAGGETIDLDTTWTIETEAPWVDIREREDQRFGDPTDDEERPLRHWKTPFIVELEPFVRAKELRPYVTVTATPRKGGPAVSVPFRVRVPKERDLRPYSVWGRGYRVPRVRMATAGPHPKPKTWTRGELLIEPVGHWPADSILSAQVDGEFHTSFGPVTLGRDVGTQMATIDGLDVKLSCEVGHGDGCGPGTILVELDGPVTLRRLKAIDVKPRPKGFRVTRLRWDPDDQHRAELRGRFEDGTTYRVTVPTSVQDAWGHRPPSPVVFDAKFVPPPPEVTLSSSRGTLRASDSRTVGLETRWVEQVRLRAAVLTDEQLASQWLRDADALDIPRSPQRSIERLIDLSPTADLGWSSIAIDLADLSGGERRPVLIEVEPTKLMPQADDRPSPAVARGLWQQTDLGAVAVVSPARSLARVHDLSDGTPRADIKVDLYRGTLNVPAKSLGALGQTNALGVIDLPRSTALPKRGLLRFSNGDDRFWLRVGEHRDPQRRWRSWRTRDAYEDPQSLLHALVTERPLYRPGDKVHIVGWTALSDSHSPAGLRPLPAKTPVELELLNRDGDVVARRTVQTTAHGKYWAILELPAEGHLGYYRVQATIDEQSRTLGITVRDFKTPSFSVSVDSPVGDLLHGAAAEARVAAAYYFGGDVPVRSFSPRVDCTHTRYRPPNLEWNWVQAHLDNEGVRYRTVLAAALNRDAEARGRASVSAQTEGLDTARPYRCTTSVAVTDESLEQVAGESSTLVHPTGYLFARRPRSWLRAGQSLRVPVRVVDFAGTRQGDVEVVVEIEREDTVDTDSGWVTKTVPVRTCRMKTTAVDEDAVCEVKPKQGPHRISIHATGDGAPQGRIEFSTWVGRKIVRHSRSTSDPLELEISPKSPKPGETAEVRVRSTHADGEGLLVLAAGGLRRAEPFTLKDGKATLKVEVDEAWVPSLSIQATLVTTAAPPNRPRVYEDSLVVDVGNEGRTLHLEIEPPTEARPNAEVEIPVTLRDASGAPTGGHVALWAVDEAVLSLKEPELPDLVERFTVNRPARASIEHDYELIRRPYTPRSDPYLFSGTGSGGGGYGSGSGSGFGGRGRAVAAKGKPAARERFETTPLFIGDVEIPASGNATVRGRMPENLTTFRVTAIASAPLPDHEGVGRFGIAEDRIRVTVPLALRAVLPRVLRPGDQAQLAAMVDNRTGPAGLVTVSLAMHDAKGVLHRASASRYQVPIEAGGQVRVPFDVRALGPGTPKIELRAELTPHDSTSEPLSDAMKVELPVTAERTLVRRSAVYGELDDDDAIAVEVDGPDDAVDVRIETSIDGTLLGGLDDVAAGLVRYPYGCLEQTASRMVPLVALGQLDEHHLPPDTSLDDFLRAGVTRLGSMQTSNGGFAYWPGQRFPHLYASAYGLWVLERVAAAGHLVPERMLDRARTYVETRAKVWAEREATSLHDDVPIALAVHALASGGRQPTAAIDRLVEHFETLPVFARGLVVLAMAEATPDDPRLPKLLEDLRGQVDRQGAVAHVRRRGDRYLQYFDSPARTDAIVMMALLAAQPDDPQVVPLARGLTVERGGGLRNTQERAYGLLALAEYAAHYEPDDPSFLAQVWAGPAPQPGVRFDALDAPMMRVETPFDALGAATDNPRVTLRRQGHGRAYYRVGMRWSPAEPPRTAVAAGIAVEASLRDARGPVDDGALIAPGTPLALDLTLSADAPLDYVVLEVPLPAGLEAIDTSIGTGRRAMTLDGVSGWWANYQELHPDRALIFADRLSPGSRRHTLYLRAATPGEFVMPPPHAEAMYMPEIHGHGVARRVRVAPPTR